jgi:hypothetical protein
MDSYLEFFYLTVVEALLKIIVTVTPM